MSMFSYIWNNPLIKINKKEECFDPIELGTPAMGGSDNLESCFTAYDNALLSGSRYTGDTLMSQEKELLNKFKHEYQSHTHTSHCDAEDDKAGEVCEGDNCEYICGCCEFEENWFAKDKNGDVIDRFHCVHFHENEKERFRHLKKAKKIIENWKSWKTIVRQVKKIKKLKNLIS